MLVTVQNEVEQKSVLWLVHVGQSSLGFCICTLKTKNLTAKRKSVSGGNINNSTINTCMYNFNINGLYITGNNIRYFIKSIALLRQQIEQFCVIHTVQCVHIYTKSSRHTIHIQTERFQQINKIHFFSRKRIVEFRT